MLLKDFLHLGGLWTPVWKFKVQTWYFEEMSDVAKIFASSKIREFLLPPKFHENFRIFLCHNSKYRTIFFLQNFRVNLERGQKFAAYRRQILGGDKIWKKKKNVFLNFFLHCRIWKCVKYCPQMTTGAAKFLPSGNINRGMIQYLPQPVTEKQLPGGYVPLQNENLVTHPVLSSPSELILHVRMRIYDEKFWIFAFLSSLAAALGP